ncbi:MAG TPA: hypothetical protein VFS71_07200 [Flavobacterium sp.]|uniref:hypothetical protein n=1 Tax=Flavobacterium sp. TaxID=239 RepID=UPI002DBA34C4|nr:hypothetical protein [Flavobacterium sp.]HEU4789454.1 hypothetical protein [Flavobacterium sp.]
MEIKTFWSIIIKLIGLWFLVNCFYIIPQLYGSLSYFDGDLNWESLIWTWLFTLLGVLIYCFIIRIFIFKTNWVVEKLKLDQGFTQEKIDLNISSYTVLQIVVILIGGYIFIQGLPVLCQQGIEFFQQKVLLRNYNGLSYLVYNFLRTLFGFIIMTNSNSAVKYICKQQEDVNGL